MILAIPFERFDEYLGYAQGRMRKKLLGASEALRGGVPRVYIGSVSLRSVLDGAGTTIDAQAVFEERALV